MDPAGVYEIGAVTPYYWPKRVGCVIDPVDPLPGVTLRKSLFSVDLSSHPVLSISTVEHVGTEDYGIRDDKQGPIEALQKVWSQSPVFLITVPVGYNTKLDEFIFNRSRFPDDVRVRFLVRLSETKWREEKRLAARIPYGPKWANALVVIERGNIL